MFHRQVTKLHVRHFVPYSRHPSDIKRTPWVFFKSKFKKVSFIVSSLSDTTTTIWKLVNCRHHISKRWASVGTVGRCVSRGRCTSQSRYTHRSTWNWNYGRRSTGTQYDFTCFIKLYYLLVFEMFPLYFYRVITSFFHLVYFSDTLTGVIVFQRVVV